MTNTWLKRRVYLQWAALLALVPLFLTADMATGGPGADKAVSNDAANQCALPPFLNVALSERPNVMVLYDNSSSMSLQGYSKSYDPKTHYYGLYNADSCYSYTAGNPGMFTKAAIYPEEVIDPGVGAAYANPAIDYKNRSTVDPDIRTQHYVNNHFCTNPVYPWSGNFLNWFTMRRVDLLRKAFTGGLSGGGNGNRVASALEGESAFAPCYNKSYIVPTSYITSGDGENLASYPSKTLTFAASPYYVVDPKFGRMVYGKNLNGDLTLGYSCPSGTEVLSKSRYTDPAMVASAPGAFKSLAELVKSKLARISAWVESRGTKVASLFPVMSDAGQAIVSAAVQGDLRLDSWTVTDASGTIIAAASPGQTITVKATITNILNNKDFPGDPGGFLVVIGAGPGSSPGDAPIGQCNLPAINRSTTVVVTCNLTVPIDYSPANFSAPNARLGLYVNADNSPNETTVDNNWGAIPFDLVKDKPDLRPAELKITSDLVQATVEFKLINDGKATGTFNINAYWSAVTVVTLACEVGLKADAGAEDTYKCSLPLPGACTTGCEFFISVDPLKTTSPAESDLTNNIASIIYVPPDPTVWELGFSDVNIPSTVDAGGDLQVDYALVNSGGKDSDETITTLTVTNNLGMIIATTTCKNPIIPASSNVDLSCTVTIPPGTATDTYFVTLTLDKADPVLANNTYSGTTKINAVVPVCAAETDCAYDIVVNFFNKRRTGILWTFNKKELPLGQNAPANLGLAKFTDFDPAGAGLCGGANTLYGGKCTGNEFDGAQEGQQMANSVVAHLEQTAADMPKAPLSIMLLNLVKYYQSRGGESTYKKASDPDPFAYDVDPLKNGNLEKHKCRRNYVLMISDGLAYGDEEALITRGDTPAHDGTVDLRFYAQNLSNPAETPPVAMPDATLYNTSKVPNTLKMPVIGTNGSYHLDNVALYANYQGVDASSGIDLRPDITGKQTVQTVVVHTFSDGGTSTTNFDRSQRLMQRTAINGSYVERDGVPGITSKQEWDADFDGQPDAYFQAKEGDDLAEVILRALNSILLKTASGTSVSVIASTARGEGAIYQSYFRPTTADAGQEINWIGFLQALWVDKYNNLREDTNNDGKLVLTQDRVLETVFNEFSKETFAYFYNTDAAGNQIGAKDGPYSLNEVTPIFEAGRLLHKSEASSRKIYTWPHWATDAVPSSWPMELTDAEVDSCGSGGGCLKKHMWPGNNFYYDVVSMTTSLVRWVRGDDMADNTFRKRRMTVRQPDDTLVTGTWKLGDVVYSTPTVVGAPEERYDLLYGDRQEGYSEFYAASARRKRMVYVGANDGMLHAFNGGVFRDGDDPSTSAKEAAWYQVDAGQQLGQELWSYVPGSLLPNLRMLADAGYDATCHIYYVDLKPKVTDVQIFFDAGGDPIDDDIYVNGWGTILIGGMRLGCGKTEYASYFVLDITRPDTPYLLAEFGDHTTTTTGTLQPAGEKGLNGLDFSFFYPVVLRVDDPSITVSDGDGNTHKKAGRWFMVVGSGPDKIQHTSTKANTYVYAFDLTKLGKRIGGKDGSPSPLPLEQFTYAFKKFADGSPLPANGVISNGLTADLDADFGVDSAYLSVQIDAGYAAAPQINQWKGAIWRLSTFESPDPTTWKIYNFFSTDDGTRYQAITGSPGITRDPFGNIWVYFGTGRFLSRGSDPINEGARINDLTYGNGTAAYQQSLYGVIDPCWAATPLSPCTVPLPIKRASLVRTDGISVRLDQSRVDTIACTGICPEMPAGNRLDDLITLVKNGSIGNYGWYREMVSGPSNGGGSTWEMSYNKPAVAGSLVLFTTYMPSEDTASCTIGGLSFLYVVNYQTGTAAKEDPFGTFVSTTTGLQTLKASKVVGKEPPSPPSIFGKQVFVQGSNAKITGIKTEAQFKLKPRMRGLVED